MKFDIKDAIFNVMDYLEIRFLLNVDIGESIHFAYEMRMDWASDRHQFEIKLLIWSKLGMSDIVFLSHNAVENITRIAIL